MDKLLQRLKETSAGVSLCGLYLGGAAHADDVRAIATSATVAKQQSQIIQSFATCHGLKFNSDKSEVVKISQSNSRGQTQLQLTNHSINTVPQAICLGYHWSHDLSAKPSVESNQQSQETVLCPRLVRRLPWTLKPPIRQRGV